ncbi:TetR/AcrR family transcriptional regulator [Brevibacterium casei]|uniref:TetR/AcrR family transcriptional regulator C-terminal domain-containing protein n=1 Tax=Brevibacterium casei TaxID=33889 RepID=A0A7T4A0D3_9MICO|nr:TetR/AcrR family transcriptional regulator C-terminal domain-containing protein [Brevibacterium casei]QQB15009.1 TetR/AcrR family transcriptional regulator C-terminal domain-containing protein [Brevibacterium casei]
MARPTSPLLSREKIALAAIEMLDAGEELRIQPLAKRLGVSLSSLYHHVDGRDGIVHAMREVLNGDYDLVTLADARWQDSLRAGVGSLWRLYADHPRVMIHLLGVTIDEPESLRLYEALLGILRRAGLPEDELLTTLEVLDAFAFGVALDALSPNQIFAPGDADSPLAALAARHPTGTERNRLVYDRGLDLLIAGIEARVG